jgi:hypothetical protein
MVILLGRFDMIGWAGFEQMRVWIFINFNFFYRLSLLVSNQDSGNELLFCDLIEHFAFEIPVKAFTPDNLD